MEGLSTGRCAFCHAPVGSSLRRECDHCDTDLTTGADWVLLEVDDPVAEG